MTTVKKDIVTIYIHLDNGQKAVEAFDRLEVIMVILNSKIWILFKYKIDW